MTCEVAVMNKYAVVIAADSAVTTASGNGNERYSKGGNKIFQLSRQEPVGVMIHGSAMLDGVPWEIIIKNFRDKLGSQAHPALQDYATAFFKFVKTADFFFPQADLDRKLFDRVLRIVLDLIKQARQTVAAIDDAAKNTQERQAAWAAFAQSITDELDQLPMHPGSEVRRAYLSNAQGLVEATLLQQDIVELPADFDQTLAASADAFSQQWLDKMLSTHYHPMKRVIASLPIQEMVHLAETLIVLQSLKERITTHSESVGGPVDVAVITKAEGLVWIKRKHYFDADRNLPYVMRQRALYEDKP
ncbi:MAG: hypothetical protein V4462_16315 [Pseudomonadota bacterium]